MSQYEAKCATNTFRVRSVGDLRDALETEGFTVITNPEEFSPNCDAILLYVHDDEMSEVSLFAGGEYGMWPDFYDYETDEEGGGLGGATEAVCTSLQDNSIAIFTEIGAEKWDLSGYSVAVSPSGEVIEVNLTDIMQMAQGAFSGATVLP